MEFIIIWIIFGLWAAVVAQRRTGETFGGFLLGVLLGPIGVLICYLRKPTLTGQDRLSQAQGLVPCPHCAERIRPQANVCRYCNRDVQRGVAYRGSAS